MSLPGSLPTCITIADDLWEMMMTTPINIGIVTVSDRASRGEYEDLGGPAIEDWIGKAITNDWQPVKRIIPDEQDQVETVLRELCDEQEQGCQVMCKNAHENYRVLFMERDLCTKQMTSKNG